MELAFRSNVRAMHCELAVARLLCIIVAQSAISSIHTRTLWLIIKLKCDAIRQNNRFYLNSSAFVQHTHTRMEVDGEYGLFNVNRKQLTDTLNFLNEFIHKMRIYLLENRQSEM